jgi:arginyl-tRNA synthetase
MGKFTKPVTLDDDLREELTKVNASGLINELLKDYFNKNKSDDLKKLNQKLAEVEEKKRQINRERREIKQKIEKIKQREARVLKIFNSVPKSVVEEIKSFPNMTLMSLRLRYRDIYSKQYSFTWLEIKKVFEELRK